jgi:hypothetical protein
MVKTVGIVVRASYLKRCNIINGIKPEKWSCVWIMSGFI